MDKTLARIKQGLVLLEGGEHESTETQNIDDNNEDRSKEKQKENNSLI